MNKGNETFANIFTEHIYAADRVTGRGGKRAAGAVLILLLALFSLHSESLHWSWHTEDTGISFFRYQKNTRKSDGWTVVDSPVTGIILPFTGDDTLYVEASYDGENWSETASARYSLYPEYSLTLNEAPYSKALYLFYNGFDTSSKKTKTGSVCGFSLSLEFDFDITKHIRLYPEAGFRLQTKESTVIPHSGLVDYLTLGAGADWTFLLTDGIKGYTGAFGGVMMHINSGRYSITPYFGLRAGVRYTVTEHIRVGLMSRVTMAVLKSQQRLNDSLTILIDPVSVSLTYLF